MVVGIGVTVFVALLVALERVTQDVLHIELPIITALALVVTIALLGPLTDLLRRVLRGRSPRDRAYYRLLQALGEEVLTAQRPDTAVLPALARLTRIFRLRGRRGHRRRPASCWPSRASSSRTIRWRCGCPCATTAGRWGPSSSVRSDGPAVHRARGRPAGISRGLRGSIPQPGRTPRPAGRRTGNPLRRAQGRAGTRGSDLSEALVEAAGASAGLHVFALGPLRVERQGELDQPLGRREGRHPPGGGACSPSSSTAASTAWPRTSSSSSSGPMLTWTAPTWRSTARSAACGGRSSRRGTAAIAAAPSPSTTTATGSIPASSAGPMRRRSRRR